MVFNFVIRSSEDRVINEGQIHVEGSPFDQKQLYVQALAKLSAWLEKRECSTAIGSISLTIAHI